ncbi:hypothetical protein PSHT_10681 [Puccinia striiformis]|uniref:Uncharacterized protein n=3 Tax=Puccinia striiformis TaxID=27350 RepID=A0A2S4V816_9BASI|nr:hypothetical protein PSHT_10681 [Puccinia striiformis]
MVEIKPQDQELGFDGRSIEQFLDSYQSAAELDGASEYDMAHQICFFLRTEELMDVVEVMDGYDDHNWTKLKASMLAYWGRTGVAQFDEQDLEDLLHYWSEKESITPAEDYPFFCKSFETIVSFLLRNNDRIGPEEIQDLCYEAFSAVLKSVHRSSSDFILNRNNHEIDYQATTNSSSLLEPCTTFSKDVIATTSVPKFDERSLDAEPEPLERPMEDPQEVTVSLFPLMPPPTQCSLFRSEACVEEDVKNNHLNALDVGQHEFLHPKVPDIRIFGSLTINPLVKEEKKTLAPCHQVKKTLEDSMVSFGYLVSGHNISASDSHSSYPIDLLHEERGEDHNYFIDQPDPLSYSFETQTQDKNLDEELNIRFPVNLKFFPSDRVVPPKGSLCVENKLPLFCSKEEDTLFSNHFTELNLKKDQDLLFQDLPQDPLRDKNKLLLFHLMKNTHPFPESVSPFQVRLRDDDKLSCSKLGRKKEAKWRNWGTKVSPPNCTSPWSDTPFVVKTLSRAMYVSKTLLLPLSFNSALLGQIAALLLKEKAPATQSIQGLNTQQYLLVQSLSSNQDLDCQSPISGSRFNGVGHIRLFIFVKLHSPTTRFTRNQKTPPFPHHTFLLTEHQQAQSPEINQAFDLSNFSFPPLRPLVACKTQKSNHLAIDSIKTIPPSLDVLSFCGSFNRHLNSSFQGTFIDSFATIASDSISLFDLSGGRGLAWNRSGIGPHHVFPSEDHLRNEDKLPSFYWNSSGSLPEEALQQRKFKQTGGSSFAVVNNQSWEEIQSRLGTACKLGRDVVSKPGLGLNS